LTVYHIEGSQNIKKRKRESWDLSIAERISESRERRAVSVEWLVLKTEWLDGRSAEFKVRKELERDKSFESFRKDRRIRYKSIYMEVGSKDKKTGSRVCFFRAGKTTARFCEEEIRFQEWTCCGDSRKRG